MSTGRIEYAVLQGTHVFKLVGEVRALTCSSLDHLLDKIAQDQALTGAIVDLTETTFVDSTTLGVLAKLGLHLRTQRGIQPIMLSTNADITTLTNSMGLGQVFVMLNCKTTSACTLTLPEEKPEAHDMLETVLQAHQTLMNLNDHNKTMFQPLVHQLEQEHHQNQQQSRHNDLSFAQRH